MADAERDPFIDRLAGYLRGYDTCPRPAPAIHVRSRHQVGGVVAALVVAGAVSTAVALGHGTRSAGGLPAVVSTAWPSARALPTRSLAPLGYVPWRPLRPAGQTASAPDASPAPPPAVPAGTPVCRADQLEGGRALGGGATGHSDSPIVLRNRSGVPCSVDGYADITILDATGAVLASAAGTANRGTFFADAPSVAVLMQPGTPPIRSDTWYTEAPRGQSFMNIEWTDCRQRRAARLVVDLPEGGGRLVVPFDVGGPYSPACGGGANLGDGGFAVTRGPLTPTGWTWHPSPRYLDVAITVSAPDAVRPGAVLVYDVTISNRDATPYPLDVCPDYTEQLGGKAASATYQLDCSRTPVIAPASSVTFEMRLTVLSTVSPGPAALIWALADGRIAPTVAQATVTVTG